MAADYARVDKLRELRARSAPLRLKVRGLKRRLSNTANWEAFPKKMAEARKEYDKAHHALLVLDDEIRGVQCA